MSSRVTPFEARVLEALVAGDPEEAALRDQMSKAVVTSRDYSGVGVFVNFAVPATSMRLGTSNRYIEQTPKTHLEHPDVPAGAGALLWFEDGWLATLECYTYDGAWPADESLFSVHDREHDA
jgi:hypothetical protein